MSESHKGKIGWNKGQNHSKKTKEKISDTLTKVIYQIIDDNIVKEWYSSEEALIELKLSNKTIGNYCRQKDYKKNRLGLIYKIDYEKTK